MPRTRDQGPELNTGNAALDCASTDLDVRESTEAAASSAHPTDRLKPGESLGRYVVLELLGAGGMGSVYSAYDPRLDRRIALKVIRFPEDAEPKRRAGQARLVREAKALAKLSHPNIVTVFDVGEVDGRVYIAMEYVAGQDLRQWLAREPRSWQEILAVFVDAGLALHAAHEMDIVHRDIKPENLLISDKGELRIIDLGIARLLGESLETGELEGAHPDGVIGPSSLEALATEVGVVLGTPAYMALEQFHCQSESRTDQFSFAVCLFEALYGRPPFDGAGIFERMENLQREKIREVPASTEVPDWIFDALRPALSAKVEDRCDSMLSLLQRLRRPEIEREDEAQRLQAIAQAHHQGLGSKHRATAGVATLAFVLVAVLTLYFVKDERSTPYSNEGVLAVGALIWFGVAAVLVRWRRIFLLNNYNKQWGQTTIGAMTALLGHRFLGFVADVEPIRVLQGDLFVMAACALMAGYLSRLLYLLSAVLFVLAAAVLLDPSLTRILVSVGGVLCAITICSIWIRKDRAASLSDSPSASRQIREPGSADPSTPTS